MASPLRHRGQGDVYCLLRSREKSWNDPYNENGFVKSLVKQGQSLEYRRGGRERIKTLKSKSRRTSRSSNEHRGGTGGSVGISVRKASKQRRGWKVPPLNLRRWAHFPGPPIPPPAPPPHTTERFGVYGAKGKRPSFLPFRIPPPPNLFQKHHRFPSTNNCDRMRTPFPNKQLPDCAPGATGPAQRTQRPAFRGGPFSCSGRMARTTFPHPLPTPQSLQQLHCCGSIRQGATGSGCYHRGKGRSPFKTTAIVPHTSRCP